MAKSERPIIIKRIIVAGGGHHGGAWKVAYADFVTALMAFFLVMWIVGQSQEVKAGVGGYFRDPTAFSEGGGGNGVLQDFGHDVLLPSSISARGDHVVLQVFGDDASGENPPGPDLNQVRVTLFTGLQGWRLHEVIRGDTLSEIARDVGENTRFQDIFEANRDILTDPDEIVPGQVLRVPLL